MEKKNRLKKRKKKATSHWAKKPLPKETTNPKKRKKRWIASALVLTTIAAYGIAHLYYNKVVDNMYSGYVELLPEGRKPGRFQMDYIWDKIGYVHRIRAMESRLDDHLDSFTRYIQENARSLIPFTEHDMELEGIIQVTDKEFKVKEKPNLAHKLIKYVDEFMVGNYRNKDELLRYLDKYPEIFYLEDKDDKRLIMETLDFMRLVTRERLQDHDDFKDVYKHAKKSLRNLQSKWRYSSAMIHDDENPYEPNTMARWHTHPKNDPSYFPSDSDMANTILLGPNFLFSQHDGVFRAYVISKGSSKLVYQKNI